MIVAICLACTHPAAITGHGSAGIPAWVLLAVALAVAAIGATCWRPNLTMQILAVYWLALAAAAAAPILRASELPSVTTWPIAAALVPVLLREGLRERAATCRAMTYSALVLPGLLVVDLVLAGAPAPPVDALILAAVLVVGYRSAITAKRIGV